MNAYELAEELDEYNADGFPVLIVEQAVNMLRQQADRIAELENPIMQAIGMAFEKPLSDEDINEIYLKHGNSGWDWQIAFAREIEERHGIK